VGTVQDLRWSKQGTPGHLHPSSVFIDTIRVGRNEFVVKGFKVDSIGVYTCTNLFNGVEETINVIGGSSYN